MVRATRVLYFDSISITIDRAYSNTTLSSSIS
jgi:hypothetical protein